MTNEEKTAEFICTRRNAPLPKLMPTDFCMGCEENMPDIFNECLGKTGGMISVEDYEKISAANKAAAENQNIFELEIDNGNGTVSIINLLEECHCEKTINCIIYRQFKIYEDKYKTLAKNKNSVQKLLNAAINQTIDTKAQNRRLNIGLTAMVGKTNEANAHLRNEQVKNLKLRQALEKILNDDDKPACVNEEDCPLNGGDGFDNHCNMSCPFVIAKQALGENE